MHIAIRSLLALGACIASAPAFAQDVTCENNPMKPVQFCKSSTARTDGVFYFFGTSDAGDYGNVLFSFQRQASSHRPDGIMVKLDAGQPFRVEAIPSRPDVDCSRYGCVWSVGAIAKFSDEDLVKLERATTMLVSYAEASYVSDPVTVDPRRIASWYRQWQATTTQSAP